MEKAALFAGGCFWGVEAAFKRLPGVVHTKAGYAGGTTDKPTYRQVCREETGHAESVLVVYDDEITDYHQLLEAFFNMNLGQTCGDSMGVYGSQYRSIVFYGDQDEKETAEQVIDFLNASGLFDYPLDVELAPMRHFYFAEEYHQNYYEKHGLSTCGCNSGF